MTLQEHKAKILEEFGEGDFRTVHNEPNFEKVAWFLSQAIDSTAEETHKATLGSLSIGISQDWDDAVELMESKYKEFTK